MRELNEIKLSNRETVKIIKSFNWGEKENVESFLMKGASINQDGFKNFDTSIMLEAKYNLLGIAIKEIINEAGVSSVFTKDWMDNLSVEDGDLVYNAVDDLGKKKIV